MHAADAEDTRLPERLAQFVCAVHAANHDRAADRHAGSDKRAAGIRRSVQIDAQMALISSPDQDRLRQSFAEMTRPVRLLFFTRTFGCETCVMTRQILSELPLLTDQITIEEVNAVLDLDRMAEYAVDRAPAIAILDADGEDSRIRFLGTPSGYEFVSLVQAVLLVGGREPSLSEANRARVAEVGHPITIHVFTTPTCPHCPRAVGLAHEMAFANPNITAYAVETTEFPDLTRRYMVNGVPKTVVAGGAGGGDPIEILGSLPQDDFIDQALGLAFPRDGTVA
jgi:glutaredoxin-like protein